MDKTLTFEQQQEVDRLSKLANTPSSNSNKYRHQLYAYIDGIIEAHTQELEKAYGGCHNCYGKGYATVNDRWHGYATDGDIGGLEGHISGGNHNAMKFCKCSRGKQLRERIEAHTQAARLDEIERFKVLDQVGTLERLNREILYIDRRIAELTPTKEIAE